MNMSDKPSETQGPEIDEELEQDELEGEDDEEFEEDPDDTERELDESRHPEHSDK